MVFHLYVRLTSQPDTQLLFNKGSFIILGTLSVWYSILLAVSAIFLFRKIYSILLAENFIYLCKGPFPVLSVVNTISLYYTPPAVLCFAPLWPSLASSLRLPGCFSLVNKVASVISKGLLQHWFLVVSHVHIGGVLPSAEIQCF